jgi:hypothetical protein
MANAINEGCTPEVIDALALAGKLDTKYTAPAWTKKFAHMPALAASLSYLKGYENYLEIDRLVMDDTLPTVEALLRVGCSPWDGAPADVMIKEHKTFSGMVEACRLATAGDETYLRAMASVRPSDTCDVEPIYSELLSDSIGGPFCDIVVPHMSHGELACCMRVLFSRVHPLEMMRDMVRAIMRRPDVWSIDDLPHEPEGPYLYQLCVNDIEYNIEDAFAFLVEEGRSNAQVIFRGKKLSQWCNEKIRE